MLANNIKYLLSLFFKINFITTYTLNSLFFSLKHSFDFIIKVAQELISNQVVASSSVKIYLNSISILRLILNLNIYIYIFSYSLASLSYKLLLLNNVFIINYIYAFSFKLSSICNLALNLLFIILFTNFVYIVKNVLEYFILRVENLVVVDISVLNFIVKANIQLRSNNIN